MNTDYGSNSHKKKEEPETKKEPKKIEKVVVGEVTVQKKSLGRKFKDLIVEAKFRDVVHYICRDVLLPAARSMIVDAGTKGVERMVYGEHDSRRRTFYGSGSGPRVTYNNPINRARDPRSSPSSAVVRRYSRHDRGDYILSSREDAEAVLEQMNDIIDKYEVVSVADLHEMIGEPKSHVDNKWGWVFLGDVPIRQIRDGYLVDFPPPEPIDL